MRYGEGYFIEMQESRGHEVYNWGGEPIIQPYNTSTYSPAPAPAPAPTPEAAPAAPAPAPAAEVVPKSVGAAPSIKDIIDLSLLEETPALDEGNESIISSSAASAGGVDSSVILIVLVVLGAGAFFGYKKLKG